jgi:hypothetical protein
MHMMLKITAKFLLTLTVMTILCTMVWQQLVADTLYHCTDAGWLDYLSPGHWVHNPVSAAHVVPSQSMSEPDTIKVGWSIGGLWGLWYSFVGVSMVVSLLLSRASSIPRCSTRRSFEPTHIA